MQTRNKKELKTKRIILRKNMPAPELVFWQVLRGEQLAVKFRRQFSFDNFILDFYAPKIGLAVEIDGDSHFENSEAVEKDKRRDKTLLEKYGITVLRFTNKEIMENLDGVIENIQIRIPPLNLPLSRTSASRGRN